MIRFAKISLFVILFGQLGFNAVAYYMNFQHPSWPFWIILYGVTGVYSQVRMANIKVLPFDILFFSCIGYVVSSYALIGESNSIEFTQRILLFMLGPYICGRFIGHYFSLSLFKLLYGIAILYVLLVGMEVFHNPSVFFDTDRLILFATEDWSGMGGNPTAFYIGTTLGAACVAAFVTFVFTSQKGFQLKRGSKGWLLGSVALFWVILLFVGSRGSLVAVIVSIVVVSLLIPRVLARTKYALLIGVVGSVLVIYPIFSESRKILFRQIPAAVLNTSLVGDCILTGNSIISRMTLLGETWRLFLEAPIFGVGATNFGLRYCGVPTEYASPHSTIAQVLVELGLFGTILWTVMFFSIIWMFYRNISFANGRNDVVMYILFALWLFFFITNQFSGNIYYDYHIYIITGLLVSIIKYRSRLPILVRSELKKRKTPPIIAAKVIDH